MGRPSIKALRERYKAAAHAVQTGIAYLRDQTLLEPKHMRVGIDMSKSDQAALAGLLIRKGIITEAEYYQALADQAEVEVESWRRTLADQYGCAPDKINLR